MVAIRLFHKTLHGEGAGQILQGAAALDIAVTGFRRIWGDPKSHQIAALRSRRGTGHSLREFRAVSHNVIRWHDQRDTVGISFSNHQSRDRDGRRRVASGRLQDNAGRGDVGGPHLFGDQEAMFGIADNDWGPGSPTVFARRTVS